MRFSTASFLAVAVAPVVVSAAPIRRTEDPGTVLVVKFANVLEQLETQFYTQALAKFQPADFTAAGFTSPNIPIEQFTVIQADEATHAQTLAAVLQSFGETPLNCTFDFSSALTSVSTMLPVARIVEQVGVGAYLGASPLVKDLNILVDAGTIATVEARHQTILNVMSGETAISQAFDIALTPPEVLTLAGPFITGKCDLGITANPPLSITNTGTVTTGTSLTFSSSAINGSTTGLFCQMLVGGAPDSISLPINNCVVPSSVSGPVAIFVTSDNQPLNGNPQQRVGQKVLAGPTMAFIDTTTQTLGELVHPNNSTGAGTPPSVTATVPPAAASSLLSGLGTTPPSPGPSGLPTTSTNTNSTTNNSANGNGTSSNSGAIANGVSMIPKPSQAP